MPHFITRRFCNFWLDSNIWNFVIWYQKSTDNRVRIKRINLIENRLRIDRESIENWKRTDRESKENRKRIDRESKENRQIIDYKTTKNQLKINNKSTNTQPSIYQESIKCVLKNYMTGFFVSKSCNSLFGWSVRAITLLGPRLVTLTKVFYVHYFAKSSAKNPLHVSTLWSDLIEFDRLSIWNICKIDQ